MANAVKAVKKFTETGSGAATYQTTNKLTPLKNHLYLICVITDNFSPAVTVTGCGMTWVSVANEPSSGTNSDNVWLLRGMSATGVADFLTVSFNGQKQNNFAIGVIDFGFVDVTGTNGSGAVVQALGGSGTGKVTTQTLLAFGNANNAAFVMVRHASVEDTHPEAGHTELFDIAVGNSQFYAGYRPTSDVSPNADWNTSVAFNSIQAEIKWDDTVAKVVELGVATEKDFAPTLSVVGGGVSPGSGTVLLASTTRGGVITRVGEKLGLAYDVDGFERSWFRDLANRAVEEVLLATHAYIDISETTLTSGQAEYRLPVSVLAIDNGRGSTPSGIGAYTLIALSEMIERQSVNFVSSGFRKFIAIEGNLLIVSPTPGTGEVLRFYYVPKPTAMSADTHDFTNATYGGLPDWADRAVEYYMLWQAGEYDQKQPTSSKDVGPIDYLQMFERECAMIRKRKRQLRARTAPSPRIGYPGSRRPYVSRNDVYPTIYS